MSQFVMFSLLPPSPVADGNCTTAHTALSNWTVGKCNTEKILNPKEASYFLIQMLYNLNENDYMPKGEEASIITLGRRHH